MKNGTKKRPRRGVGDGGPSPTTSTSIRIREDLHERARIYGIRARPKLTFTDILNDALEDWLKKHSV